MPARFPSRILIADDEPDYRILTAAILEHEGYETVCAASGVEVVEHLSHTPDAFDLVFLDWHMPLMDGLATLQALKEQPHTADIPIVMQSGIADTSIRKASFNAGACYVLEKTMEWELILAVIHKALQDHLRNCNLRAQVENTGHAHRLLHEATYYFRTLEEAQELATFLGSSCENPVCSVMGLHEIFENAIEHGNLEIGYTQKGALVREKRRIEEINHRLNNPAYCDRRVAVTCRREKEYFHITTTDDGQGFDWNPYLSLDADRMHCPNGRGIALSRMFSLNDLAYKGKGNIATCRLKMR